MIFLILGSAALFTYAAGLDPFLNLWDERFHALVAKNLMNHPLKPTLYDDPVVPTNYDRWDRYYIWLHKQPLFLWQIAASFKLFGVSEFTLRLPSIIQATILTLLIYRIGNLLTGYRTGYVSAFLFSTSYIVFVLVEGMQSVDHNDIAFLFYITCSIWAFLEFHFSGKIFYVFLIGIFAGLAVLNKWMTGLLIYAGWFVYIIFSKEWKKETLHFVLALFITAMIVMPWQILILSLYPSEAHQEYSLMASHFNNVIDGHRGDWKFYIDTFPFLYSYVPLWIVVFGFLIVYRKINDFRLSCTVISLPVITYLFFTLAKTKMTVYPFIVSSLVLLSIGSLILLFMDLFSVKEKFLWIKKVFIILFLLIIGWFNLSFQKIENNHSAFNIKNEFSARLLSNKMIFLKLKETLPKETVIFNVTGRHYIECMFYTGLPAYNFIPSFEQYTFLKKKNRRIAVFMTSGAPFPDYLINDSTVIRLSDRLQSFD